MKEKEKSLEHVANGGSFRVAALVLAVKSERRRDRQPHRKLISASISISEPPDHLHGHREGHDKTHILF